MSPLYVIVVYYVNEFSLSILMAIFPGGPGLAGTGMSPFWILLELRMMEVVVTAGAVRRAKLQSDCHHQQVNTHLFYRPDAPAVSQPNQQCQSTEGNIISVSWHTFLLCASYM